MKRVRTSRIRVPRKDAGYPQLADFFDRHDGTELLKQGIMEPDPDREDLDRMLLDYWKQPQYSTIEHSPARRRQTDD